MSSLNDYFSSISSAFGGATPIYGPTGLITGYNQPGLKASQSAVTKQPATLNPATGLYIDSTGKAYTGTLQNPDGTVSNYENGKLLPADAYGNPLPVLTSQTTVKQPEIAAAAGGLLSTANANNAATNASFNDYLAQANALNAQGAIQLTKDQAAVDPTATVNRLNTDAANTTASLNATNQNYITNQTGVQGQIAAENTAAATTTADRLAKLKSDLDAENAQYEQASQGVANQAYDKARQQISLYQLGIGTPTSSSGDLSNRYIKAYADINVPLQQQLAQRQYDETNALDAQQQAADKDAYNNLISYYSGQSALNSDVANRLASTAQYTGQLDATTAAQIQQLKTTTAGMSRAMAAQYLQQLAVPFTVAAQVLSGQISNLQQIQGVENSANYYTLNTPYNGSNIPVTTTNPGSVPRPGARPVSTATGTAGATGSSVSPGGIVNPSAPVSSTPITPLPAGAWAQTLQSLGGNMYQDPATGAVYNVGSDGTITQNNYNTQPTTSYNDAFVSPGDNSGFNDDTNDYEDVGNDYYYNS